MAKIDKDNIPVKKLTQEETILKLQAQLKERDDKLKKEISKSDKINKELNSIRTEVRKHEKIVAPLWTLKKVLHDNDGSTSSPSYKKVIKNFQEAIKDIKVIKGDIISNNPIDILSFLFVDYLPSELEKKFFGKADYFNKFPLFQTLLEECLKSHAKNLTEWLPYFNKDDKTVPTVIDWDKVSV